MNHLIRVLCWMVIPALCPRYVQAQLGTSVTVIPPSPRSVEFEKFINYKVSLSNGLPEIGINFYNIQVDQVTIPIGISYHASGIKFGQPNGDVGLGWGLTSAYRVSRTVYGRLDEIYPMPDMNNVANGMTIGYYLNNNFSTPFERDRYLARYVNPREQAYVTASQYDYLDGQFDLFTVGLPSENGNFIISDRKSKTVSMLNNSALKVDYTVGAAGIDGLKIVDMNGVKYRMGQNEANTEGLKISSGDGMVKYSSAWMISEITTPLNNTVSFQYIPFQETRPGTDFYTRALTDGKSFGHDCHMGSDIENTGTGSSSAYDVKLLSVINGVQETAIFNRNNNGTIGSIEIRKKNNELIKRMVFYYSQFADRVFLDKVAIEGSDGSAGETYKFDYESKGITYNYFDNFGYYQWDRKQGYAPLIPGLTHYPDLNPCSGPQIPVPVSTSGSSNREDYRTSDIYMLKKITYPSGGSSSYRYESNIYKADNALNSVNGGGLRIASIESDNGSGIPILKRNFSYGTDGTGKLLFNANDPRLLVKVQVVPVFAPYLNTQNKIGLLNKRTISNALDGDLADGYVKDNMGWYSQVREQYDEGYVDHFFEMPYGSAGIETFINNSNAEYTSQYPSYFVRAYRFWNKPVLTEQSTYEYKVGVDPRIKKRELFSYSTPSPNNPNNEFTGLKVTTFAVATGDRGLDFSSLTAYSDMGLKSVFNYDTYKVTSGDVLLKTKTVYDYDNTTEGIKTVYNYDYTTGNLIAKEKVSNSKDEVLITKYKYPFDFSGIVSNDSQSAGIKQLQVKNILSPVIEKSVFRSNASETSLRLINSKFTSYKSNLPLPDQIFNVESATATSNFVESAVSSGGVVKDVVYQQDITVDKYSDKGKILSVSKQLSPSVCYLWGYNDQYPVVKVVGSNYNTISALVNQSILNNPQNDQQLRAELNKIRTGLAGVTTAVTTYTYNPLVGMTSQTDAKGETTYYEYDGFQRLRNIKDQDGNIIKTYDYHYKP